MIKARFIPQNDITVYELAQIVAVLISGFNHDINDTAISFYGKENEHYDKFVQNYPDILRHFEISEVEW